MKRSVTATAPPHNDLDFIRKFLSIIARQDDLPPNRPILESDGAELHPSSKDRPADARLDGYAPISGMSVPPRCGDRGRRWGTQRETAIRRALPDQVVRRCVVLPAGLAQRDQDAAPGRLSSTPHVTAADAFNARYRHPCLRSLSGPNALARPSAEGRTTFFEAKLAPLRGFSSTAAESRSPSGALRPRRVGRFALPNRTPIPASQHRMPAESRERPA